MNLKIHFTVSKKFGVKFSEGEEENEGKKDGKTVTIEGKMDGGYIEYRSKIEDMKIFGVYPGMSEEEAKKTLKENGFYQGKYNLKLGNCLVSLICENGKVTNINIYKGSEYAG